MFELILLDWRGLLFDVSTVLVYVFDVLLISRDQVDKSAKVRLEGVEGAEDKTEQENAEGGLDIIENISHIFSHFISNIVCDK